jgi:hypothetical protein
MGANKSRKNGSGEAKQFAAAASSLAATKADGERTEPASNTSADGSVSPLIIYDLIVKVNGEDTTGLSSLKQFKELLDQHRPHLQIAVQRKQTGFRYSSQRGEYLPVVKQMNADKATERAALLASGRRKFRTTIRRVVLARALARNVVIERPLDPVTGQHSAKIGIRIGIGPKGVVIRNIASDGLASRSGKLKVGQVITHINGEAVVGMNDAQVNARVAACRSLDFTLLDAEQAGGADKGTARPSKGAAPAKGVTAKGAKGVDSAKSAASPSKGALVGDSVDEQHDPFQNFAGNTVPMQAAPGRTPTLEDHIAAEARLRGK